MTRESILAVEEARLETASRRRPPEPAEQPEAAGSDDDGELPERFELCA